MRPGRRRERELAPPPQEPAEPAGRGEGARARAPLTEELPLPCPRLFLAGHGSCGWRTDPAGNDGTPVRAHAP